VDANGGEEYLAFSFKLAAAENYLFNSKLFA
jgi:hypothetical protein